MSSRPDVMPAAVRRSCVNCETSSPMPPKTPQMKDRLRPNMIEEPRPMSPLTASPPAYVRSPTTRPIATSAVHRAATFSTATRKRARGSDSRRSIEPRSSSPRSMPVEARIGQMHTTRMVSPYFHVA